MLSARVRPFCWLAFGTVRGPRHDFSPGAKKQNVCAKQIAAGFSDFTKEDASAPFGEKTGVNQSVMWTWFSPTVPI